SKTDVDDVVRVDEKKGEIWFTAAGMFNPYFTQLCRAKLDGSGMKIVTDSRFHHDTNLSPDAKYFLDVEQKPDVAPRTVLRDASTGKELAELAKSDVSKMDEAGFKKTELFSFTANDGKTQCWGTLQFPSDFDANKKYPVLLNLYAGPESGGISPRFGLPSPQTDLGFLVVSVAGRGTTSRGKAFRDAVYGKLGIVEIDDQADGVKSLFNRPYVDGNRVGLQGTSYGGYATIMGLLHRPDVFKVGCASSSVTDWRNYDTIYTERYMGLPWKEENEAGYDAGSALKLAGKLQGRLMLYFGSSDNNVHPSNTYQLVTALEKAGLRYDMQVGPDREHTQMNSRTMWEYFLKYLKP
ncbi:S9 family peptidase, partial [bacterium]